MWRLFPDGHTDLVLSFMPRDDNIAVDLTIIDSDPIVISQPPATGCGHPTTLALPDGLRFYYDHCSGLVYEADECPPATVRSLDVSSGVRTAMRSQSRRKVYLPRVCASPDVFCEPAAFGSELFNTGSTTTYTTYAVTKPWGTEIVFAMAPSDPEATSLRLAVQVHLTYAALLSSSVHPRQHTNIPATIQLRQHNWPSFVVPADDDGVTISGTLIAEATWLPPQDALGYPSVVPGTLDPAFEYNASDHPLVLDIEQDFATSDDGNVYLQVCFAHPDSTASDAAEYARQHGAPFASYPNTEAGQDADLYAEGFGATVGIGVRGETVDVLGIVDGETSNGPYSTTFDEFNRTKSGSWGVASGGTVNNSVRPAYEVLNDALSVDGDRGLWTRTVANPLGGNSITLTTKFTRAYWLMELSRDLVDDELIQYVMSGTLLGETIPIYALLTATGYTLSAGEEEDSVATTAVDLTDPFWMAVDVTDDAIELRVWQDGDSEPAATLSITRPFPSRRYDNWAVTHGPASALVAMYDTLDFYTPAPTLCWDPRVPNDVWDPDDEDDAVLPVAGQIVPMRQVATGDGVNAYFYTVIGAYGMPYAEGSLRIQIDGMYQDVAESDPASGQFLLDFIPELGETIWAEWRQAAS